MQTIGTRLIVWSAVTALAESAAVRRVRIVLDARLASNGARLGPIDIGVRLGAVY